MALIIALVNKSNLTAVSDYQADVYVNERHIAGPFTVKGHKRADGWEALVKRFANNLQNEKFPYITTKQRQITRNIIRCKLCDTLLESRFTHDFQSCKCGNFVDGGKDYVRVGGNLTEIEILTEHEKEKLNESV